MMKNRFSTILERWFLQEPAMFQALCLHEIVENKDIHCPVRSGKRRVEFNPESVKEMSDECLEEALKSEAIRILLKHPYERKPDGCCGQAVSIGSNIVIGDNYRYIHFRNETPDTYCLPCGMNYEWYSRKIQELLDTSDGMPDNGDSEDTTVMKYHDLSGLWADDGLMTTELNGIIQSCNSWGSIGQNLVEILKASTRARINWRNVLSGFRASIISSRTKLTRMKPNRRTDFMNMGTSRQFNTKLLIAVDTSGSINIESLSYFFSVINSAFKYGFESVDVLQFDCGITRVQNIKKVMDSVEVIGRGGTSFQEPINYADEHGYDGLVILTDGYAPEPTLPQGMKCKIIWVCVNDRCYGQHHGWMEKSGRACTMELV